jgi:Xaa-Pro dipeptidase
MSAVLLSSASSLRYFVGLPVQSFERFAAAVLPSNGEPTLILPSLEAERAVEQASIRDIRSYTDEDGPQKIIKSTLGELRLSDGVIGIEDSLPFLSLDRISKAAPRASFLRTTDLIMALRLVKDEEELASMKKAGRIVEKGIAAGIESTRVGVTEERIAFEIERKIRELGGEKVPFNAVLAGRNAALPHGESSDTVVQKGDCVLMDVSATYEGYYADLTRTVFVGEVSAKAKEVYATVRQAQEAAISSAGPGVVAGELDRRARGVISARGYGKFFIHRTGHGLGLDVHEDPSITTSCHLLLKRGMAFTVEPGIYIPGKLGVRIEDDLAVTEEGVEVIGRCDKELLVV